MRAVCHPPKITLCHWLFFLGYVPYLELRLVLILSIGQGYPIWGAFGWKLILKESSGPLVQNDQLYTHTRIIRIGYLETCTIWINSTKILLQSPLEKLKEITWKKVWIKQRPLHVRYYYRWVTLNPNKQNWVKSFPFGEFWINRANQQMLWR